MTPKVKSDRRHRRRILKVIDDCKAPKGLKGQMLSDIVFDRTDPLNDVRLFGLCRDLVNLGLITEEPLERQTHQEDGLKFYRFKVTAKGTALVAQLIAPEPLVEDSRATELDED
jgi:hypothetical protein